MKLLAGSILLAASMLVAVPARAAFDPAEVLYPGITADALAIGDMDGDGRDDLVMLASAPEPGDNHTLEIFIQRPDGTLEDPVSIPVDTTQTLFPNMRLVEMTGDGLPDIAIGAIGSIHLLANQGNLQFGVHEVSVGSEYASHIEADDIDGDGHQDLVAALWGDFAILRGDGAGGIIDVSTMPGFGAIHFQLVDDEGDGDLDIAYLAGDRIRILERGPSGFTGDARTHRIPFGANRSSDPAFADFNNDGLVDFAIGKQVNKSDNPTVALLLQRPGGRFQIQQVLKADLPENLFFRDIDRDGDLDLVVPHPGSFSFGVYRSYGGSLAIEERYEAVAAGEPTAIDMGDINGDGYLDLVSASHVGGTWLLAGRSDVPGPDTSVRASIDGTATTLRLANHGDQPSLDVYLVVELTARRGGVQAGALPPGCESQPWDEGGVRIDCFLPPLAQGEERTLVLLATGVDATSPNHLFAAAMLSAAFFEVRPDNNRANARGVILPMGNAGVPSRSRK